MGNGSSQLVCFCDSSSKRYATAIHLRTIKNDKTAVSLFFSKARNAPKKKLTIPGLARTDENSEKILCTDSQCVLQWIKNTENIYIFVRNRITEIINKADVAFRCINTKHNPADIPTRGMSAMEVKNNKLWWYSPEWLLKDLNE